MFAADADRERAASKLQEHYVSGRLTVDELSSRTDRVLHAKSRADLRRALWGLEVLPDDLAVRGRLFLNAVVRGAALVVFTGAYLVFSFMLLGVLMLTLLLHGASGTALVAFLVVWLVPTYLLTRLWRRRPG
jgi:hypothetical protein